MTTFHLVRHAAKDAPDDLLVGRAQGVSLSAAGRDQVTKLVEHFAKVPLRQVLCSPLERAKETATPIAASKGLAVQVSQAFAEVEFGTWAGLTFAQLENDPAWRVFNSSRSTAAAPPGGETMLEVQFRFVTGMLKLAQQHPTDEIAVVSHADPIRAAILYLLGSPMDYWSRLEVDVASISTVVVDGSVVRLVSLNHSPTVVPADRK